MKEPHPTPKAEAARSASAGGCPVDASFSPLDAAYLADPYPFYARFRRRGPVFYAPKVDMWVVTRYDDIEAVLMDPATFSSATVHKPLVPMCDEAQRILLDGGFAPPPVMSNIDPPGHTRIRKHNARTFSTSRLAMLEPTVQRRARELIDGFLADGRADAITQLAFPLPASIIFTLIGFPPDDTERIKEWCNRRLMMIWGVPDADEQIAVAHNMVAYWRYCQDFVERRARERAEDFTSGLLDIHDADPAQLSRQEIASIIYSFAFAGHETTTNLIANALKQLLTRREAWQELCAQPALIPGAVEEVLRFDTSIIAWQRAAARDTEIGGISVPKDARLLLLLGSAGHDDAHFPDPEHFDIHRENARAHLAFSKGIHFCLGAPLARMETRIALELLSERMPDLRLRPQQTLSYPRNIAFRGPEHLWIEWDAAAAMARGWRTSPEPA